MAKRLVTDDTDDMIDLLIGEQIDVWCLNYIYSGTLTANDERTLHLTSATVVYDTGKLDSVTFVTSEKLPNDLFLNRSTIEAITLRVK